MSIFTYLNSAFSKTLKAVTSTATVVDNIVSVGVYESTSWKSKSATKLIKDMESGKLLSIERLDKLDSELLGIKQDAG